MEGGRRFGVSTGLSHLLMTTFLYNFSTFMVIPAITDVTMSALCPGKDECSLAIYLTGFQHAMIGVGTLVMMPLIGNLSDLYGRKSLLFLPMTLTILPLGILAYKRTTNFFYAYYVLRTLTSMLCEGSVQCIAFAYVADKVEETQRATVFGLLSGIASCAFVCGNLSTRFLSTSSTFQVSALMAVLALLYMMVFLPESIEDCSLSLRTKLIEYEQGKEDERDGNGDLEVISGSFGVKFLFKGLPSPSDMISLLKTSAAFSQAAMVAFFTNLGDVGFHTALMYYLKARFHFNKDQFADLMVISGVAGTASQLLVMPLLVPFMGEEKLLSIGLLFNCAHMFLYSIAWSSRVPYVAAMFSTLIVFSQPCLRSIVSKQVGPTQQEPQVVYWIFLVFSSKIAQRFPSMFYLKHEGKAQGCISGVSSFANVVSPLVFTPVIALFLSEDAPFSFPGFSIMCLGFVLMVAFIQSLLIKPSTSMAECSVLQP